MPKKMAVPIQNKELSYIEKNMDIEQNFFFAEPGNPKLCYINPYVIVTDGKDFLYRENIDSSIDIGWKFEVPKNKGNFDSLIEKCILDKFLSFWKQITLNSRGLTQDDLSLHKTGRGIYSLNRKKYFPVYFLIVPNSSVVNLYPKDFIKNIKNIGTIDIQSFITSSNSPLISYVSQKIIQMLKSGEIILPIISEPK